MLTIKKLVTSHNDAVDTFIKEQLVTISDGFFFAPNAEIIATALKEDTGISFGAFDDEILIGVRLTYIPGLNKENHGFDLGYSQDELLQVAQFHGTLIKDDKRSKGIGNELVKTNCEKIFHTGYKIILVTVHPANEVSLRMLLRNGFVEKKFVTKYSNLPRIILEKRK